MVFSFIARRFTLAATASIAARSGFNTAINLATRRTFSLTPRYSAPPEKASKKASKTVETKTKKTTTKTAAKKSAKVKPRSTAVKKKKPVQPIEAQGRVIIPKIPKSLKPPKGAPSPYLLFYSSFIKSQAHTDPKTLQDYQALSKRAGEVWRSYSLAEKQPYYDENEVRKVQAQKDKEEFFRNAGRSNLMKLNKLRVAQGKGKIRGRHANPKPMSPFLRFIADFRSNPDSQVLMENIAPERKPHERILIAAGARWRSMSTEEKEPYVEQFTKAKEEYVARNA